MFAWLILLTQLLGGILGAEFFLRNSQQLSPLSGPRLTGSLPSRSNPICLHGQPVNSVELTLDGGTSNQYTCPEIGITINHEREERGPTTGNSSIQPNNDPKLSRTAILPTSIPASNPSKADSGYQDPGQSNQKTVECPICLLELVVDDPLPDNKALLPCQHSFHLKCIDEWERCGKITCPLCRAP
ncbi:hypothetical protein PTTG_09595, partial [Puccinia triticina 1-1 BBBD Race 1]